jgi:hypothetical protein
VEISPLADGSFQGRLVFPDPGTFRIDILLKQNQISGSPFEVTVFPESNVLDASQCSMELEKSAADMNNTFTAGSITGVNLYARNKYGVLLDAVDPSKLNVHFRNNPDLGIFTGYDASGESQFAYIFSVHSIIAKIDRRVFTLTLARIADGNLHDNCFWEISSRYG